MGDVADRLLLSEVLLAAVVVLFLEVRYLGAVGQIGAFRHDSHFGRAGRHVCCPKPTRSLFTSAQISLKHAKDVN